MEANKKAFTGTLANLNKTNQEIGVSSPSFGKAPVNTFPSGVTKPCSTNFFAGLTANLSKNDIKRKNETGKAKLDYSFDCNTKNQSKHQRHQTSAHKGLSTSMLVDENEKPPTFHGEETTNHPPKPLNTSFSYFQNSKVESKQIAKKEKPKVQISIKKDDDIGVEEIEDTGILIDMLKYTDNIKMAPSRPMKNTEISLIQELEAKSNNFKQRPRVDTVNETNAKPVYSKKEIENIDRAAKLEASFKKSISGKTGDKIKKFEVLCLYFDELIKVDPYYGKMLKEIKKGYDEKFEWLNSLLQKKAEFNEVKFKEITYELDTIKKREENLKKVKGKLDAELKEKENLIEYLKLQLKNGQRLVGENQLLHSENSTQIELAKINNKMASNISPKDTDSKGERRHTKGVVIPKLDLSKIHNKYEGEKIIIVHPKSKEKSTLITNTTINNMISVSVEGLNKSYSASKEKKKAHNTQEDC